MIEVSDDRGDAVWEPGAPSLRAVAPGVVGGGLVPLVVYYSVRSRVHGDATALMIAGAPAAAWVAAQWARVRRIDPIGAITLFGFLAGMVASALLGGSAFVLKVRDSAFTCLFGLVCLASLARSRPIMFFIGRALSAGNDPARLRAYDDLWEMPTAARTFRVITCVWGLGLIGEAGLRVLLAVLLPTGPFLAASPFLAAVAIGGLFAFTVWFSRRARRLGEVAFAAEGLQYPSVALSRTDPAVAEGAGGDLGGVGAPSPAVLLHELDGAGADWAGGATLGRVRRPPAGTGWPWPRSGPGHW